MSTQRGSSSISNSTRLSWCDSLTLIGATLTYSHLCLHTGSKSKKFSSIWKNSWWQVSSDKKETLYIHLNSSVLSFGNCTQENSPKDKPLCFRLVSSARCSAISSSTKSTHKILQRTLPLASNKGNSKTVETKSGLICGDRFFWIGTYDSLLHNYFVLPDF